jgi:hypothetical protein
MESLIKKFSIPCGFAMFVLAAVFLAIALAIAKNVPSVLSLCPPNAGWATCQKTGTIFALVGLALWIGGVLAFFLESIWEIYFKKQKNN